MSVFDGLADIFTGTFGQPVKLYPGVNPDTLGDDFVAGDGLEDQLEGQAVSVTGIFNPRSVDNFGVVQPEAMLHLRAVDGSAVRDGNLVRVDGGWFRARVQEPDGKGMIPIRLERIYETA